MSNYLRRHNEDLVKELRGADPAKRAAAESQFEFCAELTAMFQGIQQFDTRHLTTMEGWFTPAAPRDSFENSNLRPFKPQRVWRKIIGPAEVRRITRAMISMKGRKITSAMAPMITSVKRLSNRRISSEGAAENVSSGDVPPS